MHEMDKEKRLDMDQNQGENPESQSTSSAEPDQPPEIAEPVEPVEPVPVAGEVAPESEPAQAGPTQEVAQTPAAADQPEAVGTAPSAPPSTPPSPPRRRFGALAAAALVLLGAFLGAVGGSLATWQMVRSQAPTLQTVVRPAMRAQPVALVAEDVDLPALYEQVAPGVVKIETDFGSGTGFVVDATEGYILTNYHVVDEAESVAVWVDERRLEGEVRGRDPSTDLAVVAVDPRAVPLVGLPLGDSDQVRPGELAIAIGFPLDAGKSITAGIISGVNRGSQAPNRRALTGLIQTDAAINPGNSGGPLLNAQGEVIGINTQIMSPTRGFSGIGFAVPINTAKRILPDLVAGRAIERPWIGITGVAIEDLSSAERKQLNLTVNRGVLVYSVYPESPAAKAGLRPPIETDFGLTIPGDVILAVDGRRVDSVDDIVTYLDTRGVGDTVTLTVNREGREIAVELTLQSMPEQPGE